MSATPRTAAGRALLTALSPTFVLPDQPFVKREVLLADILAIEAEAHDALLAALAEATDDLARLYPAGEQDGYVIQLRRLLRDLSPVEEGQ